MTTAVFLTLLLLFSTLSGLVTEGIKKLTGNQGNLCLNLIALVTALLVGGGGTAVYYQLSNIAFTFNNCLCLFLMGLASGLCSMVGYDKVSQLIKQFTGR